MKSYTLIITCFVCGKELARTKDESKTVTNIAEEGLTFFRYVFNRRENKEKNISEFYASEAGYLCEDCFKKLLSAIKNIILQEGEKV